MQLLGDKAFLGFILYKQAGPAHPHVVALAVDGAQAGGQAALAGLKSEALVGALNFGGQSIGNNNGF